MQLANLCADVDFCDCFHMSAGSDCMNCTIIHITSHLCVKQTKNGFTLVGYRSNKVVARRSVYTSIKA